MYLTLLASPAQRVAQRVALADIRRTCDNLSMFPPEILNHPIWCLYDDTLGNIVLKHPYKPERPVPCPHCGQTLRIENYRATCCGQEFKTGFGEIRQRAPVGTHQRQSGRGWASLRPYAKGHVL